MPGAGGCGLQAFVIQERFEKRQSRRKVPGAGCRELACRCSVLVPASDSEVKTTAASDSEG